MNNAQTRDMVRKGILKLLEIKDSDVRLRNLLQSEFAVDHGIHSGGASSAIIPLTALYYGGFIDLDIENPNKIGQDMFVLSKGHAVATLASIYADIGYFDENVLKGSRSIDSILNGHPGPILPGIQIATGPMGQGLGVAQGFALAGRSNPHFDVYAMTGDGELQEGPIWEAVMYAGYKRLDNLCVLVDSNGGQLDVVNRLILPHKNIQGSFESFGWRVLTADTTKYHSIYDCLNEFKNGPRSGKPTAIICDAFKGSGSFSAFLNNHKVAIPEEIMQHEVASQKTRRKAREEEFCKFYDKLDAGQRQDIASKAAQMNLKIQEGDDGMCHNVQMIKPKVRTKRAPVREKKLDFDKNQLPVLDESKTYSAHLLIAEAMKVFARDSKVVSVDSDLASTSGLESGIGGIDQHRAFNVGVAEANMMLIGEAYAALGHNVWVSTFCPFFDWKVLRRIAVGHQERLEIMEHKDGWLSEGYGLDLTFLATAADLDTQTNGATHMGNDDALLFDALAHLKIITVCCPQQLLAVMQWIMEGNKGLVYLRILRAPAAVIYNKDYQFEYGTANVVFETEEKEDLAIISSGRGVHEALTTAKLLQKEGIHAKIIDMPSVDVSVVEEFVKDNISLFIIEQNNGYLWSKLLLEMNLKGRDIKYNSLIPINTKNGNGEINYIHSGTYKQLIENLGLSPAQLAEKIKSALELSKT